MSGDGAGALVCQNSPFSASESDDANYVDDDIDDDIDDDVDDDGDDDVNADDDDREDGNDIDDHDPDADNCHGRTGAGDVQQYLPKTTGILYLYLLLCICFFHTQLLELLLH